MLDCYQTRRSSTGRSAGSATCTVKARCNDKHGAAVRYRCVEHIVVTGVDLNAPVGHVPFHLM